MVIGVTVNEIDCTGESKLSPLHWGKVSENGHRTQFQTLIQQLTNVICPLSNYSIYVSQATGSNVTTNG